MLKPFRSRDFDSIEFDEFPVSRTNEEFLWQRWQLGIDILVQSAYPPDSLTSIVPMVDHDRLRALEGKFGASFSADFVASLNKREPISQGGVAFVSDDVVWDVRTTFRLDGPGTSHSQLDRVYDLVGDAMPPGALPFAEDWAGNFYCLMITGPTAGRVVYWDHERESEDHHVDVVANSLDAFFDALVPDPGPTRQS